MTQARTYLAIPVLMFGAVLVLVSLSGTATPVMAQDNVTPYLIMYDVTDLVKRVPDFPAPRLGLASNDEDGSGNTRLIFDFDEEDDLRPVWGIDELVELIEKMIARGSWDTAGIDIIGHKGWIIITQTRNNHMDVAALLRSLERDYRVTSKLIELNEETASAIGYDMEGDGIQTLARRKVVAGMKKLNRKGDLTILRSRMVVMNETQCSSMPLIQQTTDEATVIEADRIETQVQRPGKGSGLELSWTIKSADSTQSDDETEETAADQDSTKCIQSDAAGKIALDTCTGKVRVKHNQVVAVPITNHDGTPALLLMRPQRVHD